MLSPETLLYLERFFGPHSFDLMSLDSNSQKDRSGNPIPHYTLWLQGIECFCYPYLLDTIFMFFHLSSCLVLSFASFSIRPSMVRSLSFSRIFELDHSGGRPFKLWLLTDYYWAGRVQIQCCASLAGVLNNGSRVVYNETFGRSDVSVKPWPNGVASYRKLQTCINLRLRLAMTCEYLRWLTMTCGHFHRTQICTHVFHRLDTQRKSLQVGLTIVFLSTGARARLHQGGKRLGNETSSPLFKGCVMRRRTGTSALSALPVRLVAGKSFLSTNRKSHFLYLFFSQPCTMIKTFFYSPGSQLKMFMSACILANLLHSKLAKNELNLTVSNACSCRKT